LQLQLDACSQPATALRLVLEPDFEILPIVPFREEVMGASGRLRKDLGEMQFFVGFVSFLLLEIKT
jgi:hypothetical protein